MQGKDWEIFYMNNVNVYEDGGGVPNQRTCFTRIPHPELWAVFSFTNVLNSSVWTDSTRKVSRLFGPSLPPAKMTSVHMTRTSRPSLVSCPVRNERDVQCCLPVSRQSRGSLGHPEILPSCPPETQMSHFKKTKGREKHLALALTLTVTLGRNHPATSHCCRLRYTALSLTHQHYTRASQDHPRTIEDNTG